MIRLLTIFVLTTMLLAGCATPKPAQRIKIKTVGDCRNNAGITYCDVTLDDGSIGKVEKYYAVPGNPIRSDFVK